MADRSQFRIYLASESVVFKKTNEHFGGLSNMAPGFPLVVNGIHIRTAEALYQACRYPHMQDVQRLIIDERSPMTAKMRTRTYRKSSRPDWDQVRVTIMRWCLRLKLGQNWEKFSELLLETGDRPIVERSRKDDFWGAKPAENGTLVGQNVLGRLLMELREELRASGKSSIRISAPARISNFLLLGEPIRDPASGVQSATAEAERSVTPIESVSENAPEKDLWRGNMIPKECKRLAEVDFPIAVVSKHSVQEKSARHGHPSTLHLWWARRPLAACRAMLMALLLPDPCDLCCPVEFRAKAREVLLSLPGWNTPRINQQMKSDEGVRKMLLTFIGDLANWDNSANNSYISAARALIKAVHPDEAPLVVDPFAGGGSIPLEASRLGCEAFASDLNPVACLILKVLLEDIQRYGPELPGKLRRAAEEINRHAQEELAEFYPKDPDGAIPIAYLWARTVRCESPNCGAEIPLVRSFWLSKKADRKRALRHRIVCREGSPLCIEFEIFEPKHDRDVPPGTVSQAKATCQVCSSVLPPDRVRAQLSVQHGGADVAIDDQGERTGGAMLLAVVTLREGERGRYYRLASQQDYAVMWKAIRRIAAVAAKTTANGLSSVPDEPTPRDGTGSVGGGFRTRKYGVHSFGDFFNSRQKLALVTLANEIRSREMPEPCRHLMACALGIFVRSCNGNARLRPDSSVAPAFGMQTLPITWTFPETVPWGGRSEHFDGAVEGILDVLATGHTYVGSSGQVQIADAADSPLPDDTASIWFTDPPYYDSVPYADLSDFFYVWMKRALPTEAILRDPFDVANRLTPKSREAVRDMQEHLDGRAKKPTEWYEQKMYHSFKEGRRVLGDDGVGCVVFAHKTTAGWEALLSGMVRAGWTITGSWPIATESRTRIRARESAALATSVHLICRPRPDDAQTGDWREVLRELPKRVGNWMERLQGEGIRGADLVFACIGPALEIFSRYSRVETAEGWEVKLSEYLEKVWEVVGRTALEQILGTAEATTRNGMTGVLEEDARLTALFLWTFQATNGQNGSSPNGQRQADSQVEPGDEEEEEISPKGKAKGYSLVFDVVRRFAQPLGIDLPKWEGRIIETKKGVVRLMAVSERAKQLFGEDGPAVKPDWIHEQPSGPIQLRLFPARSDSMPPKIRSRGRGRGVVAETGGRQSEVDPGSTTLDRVHAAMLLQAGGQANALRALIKAEQDVGSDFLRLANALSALYPSGTEEKRLLDAMLLAVPR
ncbi:NADAR domain-containing protein [Desulfoferrobacter suflitae]|uniref:NADAR domain-containing protein n=1 Tax=Desulfoferrobacter suflitae TaxID=2865782 RepID=UPI0021643823|nr:NADAR domain-containing protein [Desulfoferrobacter suflitae]MCK8600137.1 NADAR domain-containing protein [Desulfoferrobacter suflitae]